MANQRKGGSAAQNKRTKIIVTAVVIAVALLITFAPYMNLPFDIPTWGELLSGNEQTIQSGDALNQPFTVHVIDVGQGDSILVKSGDHAMLIDAGERGNDQTILDYLKANSVEKLDYIVATHPHSDHIGSMPKVIEGIKVDNIIMPKLPKSMVPTTSIYQKLIKAVKTSGAKVISAKVGDTYTLGDAKITIVGPVGTPEDLNNASVVMKVVYGKNSFLFTGDAEAKSEKKILANGADIKADVLKLGHHGSSTSTSEEFLKVVSPSLALISCGKDNDYGHPHKETIEKLEKYNIPYERTDIKGTIVVGSDGEHLSTAFPDNKTAEK